MKYCLNCFQKIEDDSDVCPYCHYRQSMPPKKQQYLKPGVVFENRYIIGTALGSGGFSVTYKAFDASLNKIVAIKEYLPIDLCTRALDSEDVIVFSDEEKEDAYDDGKKKFEQEAKRMARFQGVDHIVQVYDTIEANNTCYIVMEYLDGETVASFVKRYGQIDETKALRIIIPVLEALEVIHSQQMLHRDVSPSNIMLLRDGDVKLLDFGSARYTNSDYSRSLTVLFKEGFTPEEQYYTNGHQGPWSDVYSAAATLYYMLTGVRIESALDRKANDTIIFPSMFAKIHRNVETAIMNGLSVDYRMRTQSAKEMKNELLSETNVVMHYTRSTSSKGNLIPKPLKYVTSIAFVALLVFVVAISNGAFITFDEDYADINDTSQVPSLIGLSKATAKRRLQERGLKASYQTVTDPTTKANTIVSQSVDAGTMISGKKTIKVSVATGATNVYIPRYTGLNAQTYIKGLTKNKLTKIVTKTVKSSLYATGSIVKLEGEDDSGESVNVHANEPFNSANKLVVYVSKAKGVSNAGADTTVPSLFHKKVSQVSSSLKKAGLLIIVDEYVRNPNYSANTILKASADEGTKKVRGDVIHVSLSAGKSSVKVPDVRGMSVETATSKLVAANLPSSHIIKKYQTSYSVAKGNVISQNGTQGQIMSESGYVYLYISSGFTMANVAGNEAEAGVTILRNQGLNVVRHYIYQSGYESHSIIRTDPVGGSQVSCGDTINVYIQKDSAIIDSSAYEGEDALTVYNDLVSKGFTKFDYEYEYSDDIAFGDVINVTPDGEVKFDETVMIYASQGSENDDVEDSTTTDENTSTDEYTTTDENTGADTENFTSRMIKSASSNIGR